MTIRLAVPNKGRLKEPSVSLLRDAGLRFEQTERSLSAPVRNADIELLFVRADDIPEMVRDGVADAGITGADLLAEFDNGMLVLEELGYGRCELSAAVPAASDISKVEDLAGLRIATSHPNVTRRYFEDRSIAVEVVPLKGSVEVAPKLGVADAIVDLVSTGSTLMVNGLRQIGTLLSSQAVLIATLATPEVEQIALALHAVTAGRGKRYLLLNAPAASAADIASIIPGMDAPTVVPLADADKVAIHSVVAADEVWSVLPALRAAGGHDILVLRIEQLIS